MTAGAFSFSRQQTAQQKQATAMRPRPRPSSGLDHHYLRSPTQTWHPPSDHRLLRQVAVPQVAGEEAALHFRRRPVVVAAVVPQSLPVGEVEAYPDLPLLWEEVAAVVPQSPQPEAARSSSVIAISGGSSVGPPTSGISSSAGAAAIGGGAGAAAPAAQYLSWVPSANSPLDSTSAFVAQTSFQLFSLPKSFWK